MSTPGPLRIDRESQVSIAASRSNRANGARTQAPAAFPCQTSGAKVRQDLGEQRRTIV